MTSCETISAIKELTDILSNVATVVGLAIAGVWTFHHFVKERVFKPRLALTGSARRLHTHAGDYVICSITVTNVGLSQVQKGVSDVVIYGLSGDGHQRVRLGGDKILRAHEWIEPAGVLNEDAAIPLPPRTTVVSVDFLVPGRAMGWFGRRSPFVSFRTSIVETITPQDYPQDRQE